MSLKRTTTLLSPRLKPVLLSLLLSGAGLSAATAVVVACAINPQPLPPDNPDGSFSGQDAGSTTKDNAGAVDGAAAPSADTDAGFAGGGNGDGDAGDGGDGGDAGINDASDDGPG